MSFFSVSIHLYFKPHQNLLSSTHWASLSNSAVQICIWGVTRSLSKLQSTCLVNLIIQRVLNVRKTKSVAKFDGLEPRLFEDIKGIVAPERDPK